MKIMTFQGSTPAEAMRNVKQELGDDVRLIETKQVRKKTINQSALYEILVGVDEKMHIKQEIQEASKPLSAQNLANTSEDVLLNISKAAQQINDIASVAPSPEPKESSIEFPISKEFVPSYQAPAVDTTKDMKELKGEIEKISDKVKLIQHMFWEEKSPQNLGQAIPPEFAEIYNLAKTSGMNEEHLERIMHMTFEHMPLKMRENSVTVKRYFKVLLRKMVPVRIEMPIKANQKKAVMLVGPTGVGKTTSVAKLAARYSYLLDKKYKVGLIVLDTYRIGAVEQLQQYARMMKLGIETVLDPPEFTQALDALSYCDYILIDTMGSSPYDQEKIERLYACLNQNQSSFKVDTVLVMPSHLKYEDMKITYEKFSDLNIDTLMFTKLDETKGFGNIFSLLMDVNKPVSYFAIGQEVPEDLVVANSDYLVDCLLHGFTKGHA